MVYPRHCNGFTGNPLAANQVPVIGVPGFGGVQLPSGTVQGVCLMFHSLIATVLPGQALDLYRAIGQKLGSPPNDLASGLVADGWAVVWPSYCMEGQKNLDSATAMITDLGSATSGGGTQLFTTEEEWRDHLVLWCNRTFPGKKIAVCGWSQGAYEAVQFARTHASSIIGGAAHEPATIWSNITIDQPTFTWPVAPNYDLGQHALDTCPVPFRLSWGTADNYVGYNTSGTGGTPVSNTSAIVANASVNVTSVAYTGQNHSFNSTNAADILAYFVANIDPHR